MRDLALQRETNGAVDGGGRVALLDLGLQIDALLDPLDFELETSAVQRKHAFAGRRQALERPPLMLPVRGMYGKIVILLQHVVLFLVLHQGHLALDPGHAVHQAAGQKQEDAQMSDQKSRMMQPVGPAAQRRKEDVHRKESQENIEPAGVIEELLGQRRAVFGFRERGDGEHGDHGAQEEDGEGKRPEEFK